MGYSAIQEALTQAQTTIKALEAENNTLCNERDAALQQSKEWESEYDEVQRQLTNSQATVRDFQNNQRSMYARVLKAEREADRCKNEETTADREKRYRKSLAKNIMRIKELTATNRKLEQEIKYLREHLKEIEIHQTSRDLANSDECQYITVTLSEGIPEEYVKKLCDLLLCIRGIRSVEPGTATTPSDYFARERAQVRQRVLDALDPKRTSNE